MRRISLFLFLIIILTESYGQSKYGSPVDFPISLSGNVGEIRSNHFHTGLDIRASKGVGSPVFAVMDGYVSRIFVSPYGFGNALYIKNSDGTTSVYGHLDGFVSKIAQWTEKRQYEKRSFSVDLYPQPTQFPVRRGEKIAYLGNSGSSGGPHLHFEIRDARTGNPINIGARKIYNIADNIAPKVYRIHLFQEDTVMGVPFFSHSASITLTANKSGAMVLRDSVLKVSGPVYLAYECVDNKNGSSFTMGIYSMIQKVDGQVNFGYTIDDVAFSTTRYANTLSQYSMTVKTRNDVIRAYNSPNNALHIYRNVKNSGIIYPPQKVGQRSKIETTFTDDNGNSTTVKFYLQRTSGSRPQRLLTNIEHIVKWDTHYKYSDSLISVSIPRNSLYETSIISLQKDGKYYIVGDPSIPLQSYITIRVKVNIDSLLRSKALFVGRNGGSLGGGWTDGEMELKTRNFTTFSFGYDTVPPLIVAQKVGSGNLLKFKITDNLSGVASYKLTIDGAWALAKYDPKTASLTYQLKRVEGSSKSRAIALDVVDGKGNKKTYKATERW